MTLKHSWFPLIYVTRFITCHISPFYLYLSNKTWLLWHYYLTYNCVSVQTETGSYSYCMSLVITGNELYLLYITINHNLCTIFQDRDVSTTIIVLLPLYYQCLIKPLNIWIFIVDNKSLLLHSYTRALRALLFNII